MGAANAIAYTLGTSVLITAIAIAIAIAIGANVLPRGERRRDRERELRLPSAVRRPPSAQRRSSC
ncbi:hypothetical protein [Streptomyces olivochromogenes]|uniref:Uncharacterized protein n=1 Tax=Streptomyces olivochromogenes TaxID=1963 RepID=A0A250V9L0_STROL|nr:hypothetical protein [Streptomyces olivochromogenes]KUN48486.1 hypothetical protein AQJ27_06930 [Streptomyces olivochromogenes]GAX50887.1 hypothetical protein SO3561_02386 [Streptomyces olivochromogenes]